MKLSNIHPLGRYKNKETGNAVNVKKGRKVGYGVDVLFYLYRGNRIFISSGDFYGQHKKWEKV